MPRSQRARAKARSRSKASRLSEAQGQEQADESAITKTKRAAEHIGDYHAVTGESDPADIDQSQDSTSATSGDDTLQTDCQSVKTQKSHHGTKRYYQHRPLKDPKKQIRLVKLLPGDSDEIVCLRCRTWTLGGKNTPSYHGISYTWGAVQTQMLFIDGKARFVRRSCYYALWQARLHFPGEWVWIDSICIDQINCKEKSHQVQMMFDIYSSADLVLSCVGPHADNSEMIVEAAAEALEFALEKDEGEHDIESVGLWDPESAWGEGYCIALEKCFEQFSNRPYWRRLWIVQEIHASGDIWSKKSRILCGSDSIERLAVAMLQEFCALGDGDCSPFRYTGWGRLSEIFEAHGNTGIPLSDLFMYSFEYLCSDPRDKLYGFLSLLRWSDDIQTIQADYGKSGWDIFIEIAPFLSPEGVRSAALVLDVGISDADADAFARNRALVEALQPNVARHISESAQQLKIEEYPKRPVRLDSRTPLATVVKQGQLKVLPPSLSNAVTNKIYGNNEKLLDAECSSRGIAPRLPIGITTGSDEDHILLVNRRTRTGDLIVDFWNNLLVLRHSAGDVYDLIGAAIWFFPKPPDLRASFRENLTEITQDNLFYVEGEIRLSLEEQFAFPSLHWHSLCGVGSSVMELIKEPESAVSLHLKPYSFKTDIIGNPPVERLCFEGYRKCHHKVCRNRGVE